MSNDQVTIDPEFQASPPRTGHGRWLRFGMLAAAAFILGWLLRSPGSGEADTTAPAGWTIATIHDATSTTRPSATTTAATLSATAGLEAPLGEAVPGFADGITLMVLGGEWGEEVDVVRWLPSQAAPETILTFRQESPDGWEWFVGLDAAGTWYAIQSEHDVLSVRPVAAIADEGGWEPDREVVGLRVVGAAWHDTAPGRLAWLSCSRALDGPGTLYTLDVVDRSAEPMALVQFPDGCGESPLWISQWGDWGFALEHVDEGGNGWQEPNMWTILLDPGGEELAQFEQGPGGIYLVTAGPAGTVWNEDLIGGATSFLLSPDGQRRTPVPGVAEGEWVEQARWSPDGSLIAVVTASVHQSIRVVDTESGETVAETAVNPLLRIVDATTGEAIDEIDELGPIVFQMRWSSDGRYLLVGQDRDEYGAAGAALVMYDVESEAIAIEEPFRERHDFREIRTFELSAIAMQFTPIEWGLGLEKGWGPGVYTVRMSAEASPLLTEQIEGIGGKLIWDEVVVELCNIGIDGVGGGFVQVGDTFQTVEGCGVKPDAMQDAFDQFGLPESACLVVTTGGVDHEYCAPLR